METPHIEQPIPIIDVHNTFPLDMTYENAFFTQLENSSYHHDKYFKQLLDTSIHPCVCCH
jgi:hypothetical protein